MKILSATRAIAVLIYLCCFSGAMLAQSSPSAPEASSSEGPAAAQSAPAGNRVPQAAPPILTLHSEVRRVILDVTVDDANGKPVKNLTASDFTVLEDKQPQKILSFDVYDFQKPSVARGADAPPLPPNVFLNLPSAPEHGPLYVMFYDLVNTEVEDQMSARGQILKFIRSMPDGTRFAIFVNSDGLHLVQGFTSDKNALYAALDPKHSRPHVPRLFLLGRNLGYADPNLSLAELTFIGRYLDGIPGRKNLIWVAGTFPTAVFPREGDPTDASEDIKAEMNALAQAEVAVFPVNVRGVVVNCEGCTTGGGPATSSAVRQGGDSLYGDYSTQGALAAATGGSALYSNNDLSAILETATEQGGNYYTLTYSPPARDDDGKCHNIRVMLAKTGYTLSYRQSYCHVPTLSTATEGGSERADASTVVIPLQAGDVLQANMRLGAPMEHELIFSAHVHADGPAKMANAQEMAQLQAEAEFFLTHRKNRPPRPLPPTRVQKYVVDYRVFDPQLKAEAAHGANAELEFALAAFDSDGHTLNGIVNDGVPELSSEASENKAGIYRIRQSLIVPAGAASIRIGVRDRASDRLGTLEVPLPLAPEAVAQANVPKR